MGKGAAIFNGPEYTGNDATIKGHQFYPAGSYTYGSVIYRGFQYDSLILNYDAASDQLVLVFSEDGEFETITPDQEFVSSFHFPMHDFINITDDVSLTPGYYELLYDGPSQVLAKRRKEVVQANEKDYLYEYAEAHRYFILHDGRYHQIRSKGTLLSIFNDQKSDIKSFTRSNRLLFKDAPARYIIMVAQYIDDK